MSRVIYKGYRTGFPFIVPEKAQDGLPFSDWDLETFRWATPSKSEDEQISVIGPGTAYPIGFTFAEVIEMFWRIKSFKVAAMMSGFNSDEITDVSLYEATLGEVSSEGFTEKLRMDEAGVSQVEHNLILYNAGFAQYYAYNYGGSFIAGNVNEVITYYDPPYTYPSTPESWSGAYLTMFDSRIPVIKRGSLYYPNMSIGGSYVYTSIRGFGFYSNFPVLGLRASPATGTILGHAIDFFESPSGYPGIRGLLEFDSALATITITPHKYWTYGGIYHEDTGALI